MVPAGKDRRPLRTPFLAAVRIAPSDRGGGTMGSKLAAAAGVLAAMLVAAAPAIGHGQSLDLQFRGQAIVPTGTTFEGDDRRQPVVDHLRRPTAIATTRSPTTRASSSRRASTRSGSTSRDGRLSDGDVRFTDVTTLLAPNGQPYPPMSLDPEGMVLTRDRRARPTRPRASPPAGSTRSCGAPRSTARSAARSMCRGPCRRPRTSRAASAPTSALRARA